MSDFEIGPTLFGRRYLITIRDLDVSNLRCVFKVQKTIRAEPNKCDLAIFNLSPAHRAVLEALPSRPEGKTLAQVIASPRNSSVVQILAGYASGPPSIYLGEAREDLSLIYLGEVRAAHSESQGPNIITHVSSGDGEKDVSLSRIHVPIGPHTSIDVALSAIVKALGCGEGNLATVIGKLRLSGAATMFIKGTVLSGSAADELDAFCKSANLEWSIQNGKLLILDRGKAIAGRALLLSADSGLIESPSIDNKGVVSFKTLMIPDMYPGRSVVFDAKYVKGNYRVDECTYQGDTYGKEWTIECKAKLIGTSTAKAKKKK